MRCDQFIGLSPAGVAWLDQNANVLKVETHTKIKNPRTGEVSENSQSHDVMETGKSNYTYCGIGGDDNPLTSYILKDGRKVHEDVQDAPWSSGPMFFIALKWESGQWVEDTLWKDEEINREIGGGDWFQTEDQYDE